MFQKSLFVDLGAISTLVTAAGLAFLIRKLLTG